MAPFPTVTVAEWRAQVDKDLAGASFEKTLVHRSPEGIDIQPLYTSGPVAAIHGSGRFRVCMPYEGYGLQTLAEHADGGADALWLRLDHDELPDVLSQIELARMTLVLDTGGQALPSLIAAATAQSAALADMRFVLATDPFGNIAGGQGPLQSLTVSLTHLAHGARFLADLAPHAQAALVSTLPYHAAGADAADEIAVALSTGVAYLGALLQAGFDADGAARQIAVQTTVGRDTFGELCKLRALRLCWSKMLAATGATTGLPLMHAVSSLRTLTERDPWVNMLRVTTQVFAAALGGADLVTPAAYDDLLGGSELGRRVARNTALILRDESHLGRVLDAAGGSYYLETLTDELAREAWRRFQAFEAEGGMAEVLLDGKLRARLAAAHEKRRAAVAKRKEPIVGVSEFANLGEKRRKPPIRFPDDPIPPALPVYRDAEDFEALRDRADEQKGPHVTISTVGSGFRARVGFAVGFFAAGGIVAEETTSTVACICGSDESYAAEGVERARQLKANGCRRVLLAGRPTALPDDLEDELRAAGVDDFIYVGCDAVESLGIVLKTLGTMSLPS